MAKQRNMFDEKLVREYPRSSRRIVLQIRHYSISNHAQTTGYTTHLSPHGIEFISNIKYMHGALLRISISLPNYWQRKRRLVDYHRVDQPRSFDIFARVVRNDPTSKKDNTRMVLAQTLNIDRVDTQILTSYLAEE